MQISDAEYGHDLQFCPRLDGRGKTSATSWLSSRLPGATAYRAPQVGISPQRAGQT